MTSDLFFSRSSVFFSSNLFDFTPTTLIHFEGMRRKKAFKCFLSFWSLSATIKTASRDVGPEETWHITQHKSKVLIHCPHKEHNEASKNADLIQCLKNLSPVLAFCVIFWFILLSATDYISSFLHFIWLDNYMINSDMKWRDFCYTSRSILALGK